MADFTPSDTHIRPEPDEGYSEDVRSQADDDMQYGDKLAYPLAQQVLGSALQLGLDDRLYVLENIIRSIPHACKEQVAELCFRLTHFDPAFYLPHELMLHILSYLSPQDLIACSETSRAWRQRSEDEKLWRSCFAQEGWIVDRSKMTEFEKACSKSPIDTSSPQRGILPHVGLKRRESRKRPREEAFSDGDASQPLSVQDNTSDQDCEMHGVDVVRSASPRDSMARYQTSQVQPEPMDFAPPLFQRNEQTNRISWPWLYKQRCRLERNWDLGKYKTFQLPHPDFPSEGHTECVYTIQHTSNHLVSGSRDKSIRKWNLNTNRLIGKPLLGHEASVLCLQFDERPEHDIIVSGGSDSYVIIWKFSTGEIIKKMTAAHSDPVLNLRFDDRYIVTCSKDKTIKIWNRRALRRDDPIVPAHVMRALDACNTLEGDLIQEFSLLSTLIGHGAAVNAVVMHGDTIVSASGDRTLRAWDIVSGKCIRTYTGHVKGIACVQFDGRRIVSGSSDNTVRIFDAEQQAEVACLQGHGNLVRTVQARFGDLNTVTDQELEDESRQVDRDFFRALENGLQPIVTSQRGWRNPGSRRPEDLISFGTKVPPGGGGSKWARIVSGSYDESVIVWKRDREGRWVEKLRLHQGMLVGRNVRRTATRNPPAQVDPRTRNVAPNQPQATSQQLRDLQNALATVSRMLRQPQVVRGAALPNSTLNAIAAAQVNVYHQLTQRVRDADAVVGRLPTISTRLTPNPTSDPARADRDAEDGAQPGAQEENDTASTRNAQQQMALPLAAPAHHHHHHHHHHRNREAAVPADLHSEAVRHVDTNRVYKLQFDARRIISCSQSKIIMGWDFANGDANLARIGEWSVETA